MKIKSGARRATVALMIGCLMLPQALLAAKAVDESPNEFAMVGDLFVARPIGAVMTLGGVAVWVLSLPFTILAGHSSEAADTLMLGPARATFVRCLGCRNTGYTGKDKKELAQAEEKRQQERLLREQEEAAAAPATHF